MAFEPRENYMISLVIQGASPEEAAREVAKSAAAVEGVVRQSLDRQRELHALSGKATTEEAKAFVQSMIAQENQRLKSATDSAKMLTKLEDQEAKARVNIIQREKAQWQEAIKASYANVLVAHRKLSDAETNEAKKQADEEVRIAEKKSSDLVSAFKKVEAEHTRAGASMSSSWRRSMEDLENITTVVTGAIGGIQAAYGGFKAFAEDLIRTTQIYNSQHVDISAAREAISGTATDLELIGAANLAAEKDLALTGEEFAAVAKQAKKFADAVGIDSKEALSNLVDGLAMGKTKMLAHAGVLIDVTKAQNDYAKSLDISVEQLTDEDKARAIQIAGLEKLKQRMNSATDDQKNLSDVMEAGFAGVKTAWDDLVASIGSWRPPEWFLKALTGGPKQTRAERAEKIAATGRALGISESNIQGSIEQQLGPETAEDRQQDALIRLKREADKARAENAKARAEAVARGEAPADEAYTVGNGIAGSHGIAGSGRGREKFEYGPDEKVDPLKGMDLFWHNVVAAHKLNEPTGDMSEAATAEYQAWQKAIEDAFGDKSLLSEEQKKLILAEPGSELASAYLTQNEAQKTFNKAAENAAEQQQFGVRQFAGGKYTNKEIGDFATAQAGGVTTLAQQKDEHEQINQQMIALGRDVHMELGKEVSSGPSIAEMMFFGPTGAPDVLRDKMSAAQQILAEGAAGMNSTMKGMQEGMEGALASSLAASIGENSNFKSALKEQTHAVLMAMSQQAFVKAAMFGAEALGFLAMGQFGNAAAAGAAAAEFAAVGVLAGVGARATYTPKTASTVASAPTSTRQPTADSAKGDGGGGGGERNLTFVINTMYGDKMAVAKGFQDVLTEYKQQTGRELAARP